MNPENYIKPECEIWLTTWLQLYVYSEPQELQIFHKTRLKYRRILDLQKVISQLVFHFLKPNLEFFVVLI